MLKFGWAAVGMCRRVSYKLSKNKTLGKVSLIC